LTTLQNQLNPDVTVRRRGIMEKCTFCIQRIRHAEDTAESENRNIRDGEVVPACAQACPANAIVFGRIDDPTTKVSQAANTSRGSHLLEELGTIPHVTYLAGGSTK
jgi:molybdopterin-containing oxidoreductase family iron-sulfur binding subunit